MDPEDWTELRALGHRMVDDMFDYLSGIRDRPVWQPMPGLPAAGFHSPLPRARRAGARRTRPCSASSSPT